MLSRIFSKAALNRSAHITRLSNFQALPISSQITHPTSRYFSSQSSDQVGFLKGILKKITGSANKYKDDIPADYVDPNSASGNPSFRTVPTNPNPSKMSLTPDEEEGGVYHHQPLSVSHNIATDLPPTSLGQLDVRVVIGFTCDVCHTRLAKSMSKKSYTEGVVLIRCDSCRSNHLIADNLGWFDDSNINIEDILREKGENAVHIDANEGIDNITPEALERLQGVAESLRESDKNALLGGATAMKKQLRMGNKK